MSLDVLAVQIDHVVINYGQEFLTKSVLSLDECGQRPVTAQPFNGERMFTRSRERHIFATLKFTQLVHNVISVFENRTISICPQLGLF